MKSCYHVAGPNAVAHFKKFFFSGAEGDIGFTIRYIHSYPDRIEMGFLENKITPLDCVLVEASWSPLFVKGTNLGLFYKGNRISGTMADRLQNAFQGLPENLTIDDLQKIILDDPDTVKRETRKVYTLSFFGNGACNLNCRYCFNRNGKGTGYGHFSENLFRRGIEFVLGFNNIYYISIDFGLGGEPTLFLDDYKQLFQMSKSYMKTHQKEIKLGFLTNGAALDETALDWFEKNNPWIGLSLDGDKETTDSMRVDRNGKGCFDITLAAARRIMGRGWPNPPGISATLTGRNPDILENFLALWELGFRVIITKPVRLPERLDFSINARTLPAILDGYTRFGRFLKQSIRDNELQYIKAILNPVDYLGRFLIRFINHDRLDRRCGAGTSTFCVRNDGAVFPCDSFAGIDREMIGNIFDDNFKDAVSRMGDFIPETARIDSCKTCRYATLCGGPCRYLMMINDGNFEIECSMNKHVIKTAYSVYKAITANRQVYQQLSRHITLQNDQYSDMRQYTASVPANSALSSFLEKHPERYFHDPDAGILVLRGCMFHFEREALLLCYPGSREQDAIWKLYKESQFHLYQDDP